MDNNIVNKLRCLPKYHMTITTLLRRRLKPWDSKTQSLEKNKTCQQHI